MIRIAARSLCPAFLMAAGRLRRATVMRLPAAAGALLLLAPQACAATLQERLANAAVLQQYDVADAKVGASTVIVPGAIGFMLHREDSTFAVVYDLNGHQRFRIGTPRGRDPNDWVLSGLCLSEDASTVVVWEITDRGADRTRVFDLHGRERLFLHGQRLLPSPGGRYFCTSSGDTYQPLEVYDSSGVQTARFKPAFREWACEFISDRRILVADQDSARVVNVTDGSPLWVLPLNLRDMELETPLIALSRQLSIAVICGYEDVVLIGLDGHEIWRYGSPDDVCAVFIDEATRQVVIQYLVVGSGGYFAVRSLDNGGLLCTSDQMPILRGAMFGSFEYSSFFCGLLAVENPYRLKPGDPIALREDSTLFLQSVGADCHVTGPASVAGRYLFVSCDSESVKYLRVLNDRNVALISIAVKP